MASTTQTINYRFRAKDENVSQTAGKIHKSFSMLGAGMLGFGKLAAVALGGAAVAAGGFAVAGVTMGIKTAAFMERAQISFKALLGTSEKAKGMMAWLKDFTIKTPFQLQNLVKSAQMLLGVGMSAKATQAALQDYGDASAALGLNQQQFQRVMLAVSQIFSSGKVHLQDINQMVNDGIPFWKLLSTAMHKPIPVLRDLIQHGKLLASDVLPALQTEMKKEYGGTMKKSMQTLTGLWSNLMDTINLGMADALQPLIPLLKVGLNDAIVIVGAVLQKLPGILTAVMTGLRVVGDFLGRTIVPKIVAAWNGLQGMLHRIDWARVGGAINWTWVHRDVIDPIILAWDTVQTRLRAIDWSAVLGKAKTAGGNLRTWVIVNVVPKIVSAWNTVQGKLRSIDWGKVLGSTKDFGAKVGLVVKGVGKDVLNAAKTWAQKIIDGVRAGFLKGNWGPLGTTLGQMLGKAIGNLAAGSGMIVGGVLLLLSKIDWIAAGKQTVKFAVPFAIGFVNGFLDALVETAQQHPMDVALFVLTFIPLGKFAAAFKPLRSMIEHLPLGKSFMALLDHTAVPVFDAIKRFTVWFGSIIVKDLAEMFPTFGRVIDFLFKGGMGGRIDAAKDFISGKVKALMESLAHQVAAGIARVVDAIAQLVHHIITPFAKAYDFWKPGGQRLMDGLRDTLAPRIQQVRKMISDFIARWIKGPWNGAGGWLKNAGIRVLDGFIDGWDKARPVVQKAVTNFINQRIKGPWNSAPGWLKAPGSKILQGLKAGWDIWAPRISATVRDLINGRIIDKFKGAFGWLKFWGSLIVRGLYTGMMKELGSVFNWVKSHIYEPIKNAIISLFHISSPSKVMAGLGGHIIGGFVLGLLKGNPVKVISHIAGSAMKALKAMVNAGIIDVMKLSSKLMSALGMDGLMGGMGVQGGGNSNNKQIGQAMLKMMGMGQYWPALNNLWMGESGWNQFALNKSSGAYGIPQSLPASKMASAGGDWRTNPATQIRWGLNYIKSVYGNPGVAYSRWLARSPHWYDAGGLARGMGFLAKYTSRPERVLSPRQTDAFERWMSRGGGGSGGGSGDVHIHLSAPNYLGARAELMDEFYKMAQSGRFRQVVKMAVS